MLGFHLAYSLHTVLNLENKFGVEAFIVQCEDKLKECEHTRDEDSVLKMQIHDTTMLKQLLDFEQYLVSEGKDSNANFDCLVITKK